METYMVVVDVALKERVQKNAFAIKVPTWHPVPLPGDLIQIPEAVAKQEQIPLVLKVTARRFIFDDHILDRLSRDCHSCVILQTVPPE